MCMYCKFCTVYHLSICAVSNVCLCKHCIIVGIRRSGDVGTVIVSICTVSIASMYVF